MQIGSPTGQRPSYRLLSFVLKAALITLAGFFFFRLLLVLLNLSHIRGVVSLAKLLHALLRGIGNDLLVVGVIFWIPLVLSVIHQFSSWGRSVALFAALMISGLGMQAALTISSLDVPFFQHFFSRFSDMVLNWKDQPQFLIRMVAEEARFWWFIGIFLILSVLIWWWILRRFTSLKLSIQKGGKGSPGFSVSMVVFLLLLLLFLQSRLTRKSYFSEEEKATVFNPMLEKISQNPMLTLAYSLSSKPVGDQLAERINITEAAARLEETLGRPIDLNQHEPMAQVLDKADSPKQMNVVVVLMESVNIERMDSGLMPQLQEIAAKGALWTSFYSSGVHTYAGIYSTLCGFPVQLRRHALKGQSPQFYNGLGTILKANGYTTHFYTTHDDRFDHMGGFLNNNGFSNIVSLKQYGRSNSLSTFGVPDHIMFDRALNDLDDDDGQRPFLAFLLTSSNHAPFRFPDGIPFVPKSHSLPQQMIEYSDWALGRFAAGAAAKAWGQRTLFVFLGDHGASGDYRFPLSYSMVHIPMVMVGPGIPKGEKWNKLGSQLDALPTIMGRLGILYRNLSFGVDLFHSERTLTVFCSDEYLGCTDGDYFLSFNFDSHGVLSRIKRSMDNGFTDSRLKLETMKRNALSFWRMADWLLKNKRHNQPAAQ